MCTTEAGTGRDANSGGVLDRRGSLGLTFIAILIIPNLIAWFASRKLTDSKTPTVHVLTPASDPFRTPAMGYFAVSSVLVAILSFVLQ